METPDQSVIDKLIQRMDREPGFAGLGSSVQVISTLDEDDDGGPKNLTSIILRDAALTSRLLRLSNGSSRGTRNISTIDQAIAILGLNTVRSVALSLSLLDSVSNKPQSSQLHAEIVAAYFCGTLAAAVTRHNGARYNAQEAQVCGLMQNLGRMMATYYLYEDIERSHAFAAEKNLSEEDAVAQVIGMRFDEIGARIAEHWKLPDVLQQSLAAKAGTTPPRAAANAIGWHQVCALFSRSVMDAMFRLPENAERTNVNKCIAFFRTALQLRDEETHEWIDKALEETGTLLAELSFPCDIEQARSRLRKASEKVMDVLSYNDSLIKGDAKTEGKKPVEVIQQVLRLAHDAFGFDLTMLCLPNGTTGLTAIAGVGRNANQTVAKFRCQGAKPDIFRAVMAKKVDLYVPDVESPSYARFMPDWYKEQVGARSFLLLSLVRDGHCVGMLYGDYTEPHPTVSQELIHGQGQTWRMQLLNVL
jgi:HD-like signal output (HDOD) protein